MIYVLDETTDFAELHERLTRDRAAYARTREENQGGGP